MSPGEFIQKVIDNEIDAVRAALAEDPALAAARDETLGSTPLHFAAHRGFRDIVRALLDAGADVRALEAASDTTPLHWAAEGGHPVIARWLVERGADLEALDGWYGLAPLGWTTIVNQSPAFQDDKPATALCLLQAGARLDIFSALAAERDDAVRAIVAADRAQLRRRLGFMGGEMQPLHLAVSLGQLEMASLLLELGADPHARTAWGLTPLALAYGIDDARLDELLRAHGATEDASTALMAGDLEGLEKRLAAASPVTRDALLFTAALDGLEDATRVLLRGGADAGARTRHLAGEIPARVTALHLAAGNGHAAVARALLEGGAEPGPGHEEGLPTPLHLAAAGGHLEAVRALLAAGADPMAVERSFGATPHRWAEHGGHADIMALLTGQPKG